MSDTKARLEFQIEADNDGSVIRLTENSQQKTVTLATLLPQGCRAMGAKMEYADLRRFGWFCILLADCLEVDQE